MLLIAVIGACASLKPGNRHGNGRSLFQFLMVVITNIISRFLWHMLVSRLATLSDWCYNDTYCRLDSSACYVENQEFYGSGQGREDSKWRLSVCAVSTFSSTMICMTLTLLESVWKPLKGPVRDWPLALCDISSIDPDKDLEMTDTVFDTGRYIVQENYQMYHRQYHRWFYLSEQETSEITIFRQYDSKIGHGSGM